MSQEFRIAAVSFLNAIPLTDWLAGGAEGRVRLMVELPSRLAPLLQRGAADTALLPTVEILRGRSGGLLSPSGIACDGPVGSVAVFAAGPLDRVRLVQTDRGSRTSVALARVLLREIHGVKPEFREFRPEPGLWPGPDEAVLVIGDRCLAQAAGLRHDAPEGMRMHDLGGMWKEHTGLPFVFAAWAAAPAFAGERAAAEVRELGDLLTRSRDEGLASLPGLAERLAGEGKLGFGGEATPQAIAYYFGQSLRFVLGERELAGMRRFQDLCIAHGLVPDLPFPELLYAR